MAHDLDDYCLNYIDGEFGHGGAGTVAVLDPATGRTLAHHALADAADIHRAVEAARRVHLAGELSRLHPMERGRMLRKMGHFLEVHCEDVKRVLTLEQGKPLFEADVEVKAAIRFFEYFASMAESLEGRSVPCGESRFDFTVYRPYGVSAQFIPCHYPIYIAVRSLAVALVTGNACVLKISPLAPLSATWLARAAEHAGLPAGAVNILCGDPHTAGAALAAHERIDHLVFSGNMTAASEVLARCARNLVPSVVEVGGSSPTIVHEDANLEVFQSEARTGTFWNAGQFCTGMYRVIAHESVLSEVVERSVALARALELRPGIEAGEFGLSMGPLDSEQQVQRVTAIVEEAVRQGARCLAGGKRAPGPGFFMQPTILTDVRPEMRVAQEEVWGPVMAVMRFSREEQAYQIANSTPYTGVICGVFTEDLARLTRTAFHVDAGHVVTNASIISGPEIPFGGGFGRSGYGRVKGREALLGYVQPKNILLPVGHYLPETRAQAARVSAQMR